MKKFLAVFDGFKMSKSTMDYAITLTQATQAHLVGVFLDEFIYKSYSVYDVISRDQDSQSVMNELDARDKEKRDQATQQFQAACNKAGVNYSIHRDKNIAIQELKHESMFADLVFINEYETFTRYKEKPPTRFIKELLGDVQCPVIVLPAVFKPVDKVILLYDGRPSSLHAIKMFSYLFDTLQDVPVEVFTVKEKIMESLKIPDNRLMREFVKRHFPAATFVVEKGNVEEKVIEHLQNHGETELVVLGAYHRSESSRWFKASMADQLMKRVNTPLFIAHNK